METSEVRDLVTARITATVPLAIYAQGEIPGAVVKTWHEAAAPLIPERDPEQSAHMAFFVDDRRVEDTAMDGGLELYLVARLVVRFLFELRPSAAKSDWDAAGAAASHLLRRLMGAADWSHGLVETDTRPGLVFERRPLADPGWLAVEVHLDARFPFDLRPQE